MKNVLHNTLSIFDIVPLTMPRSFTNTNNLLAFITQLRIRMTIGKFNEFTGNLQERLEESCFNVTNKMVSICLPMGD